MRLGWTLFSHARRLMPRSVVAPISLWIRTERSRRANARSMLSSLRWRAAAAMRSSFTGNRLQASALRRIGGRGASMLREIVLDTETTGLDPKKGDRLIEVGCVE